MTGRRKAISKRVRFEVFKRDSFKCQYCGATAPDVVLQVDHIKPVATGGQNDITNLVTSCASCNNGKGARELSDDAAIRKQRAQLEELSQRREQLEMMLEWREAVSEIEERAVAEVVKCWNQATGFDVNDSGRSTMATWVRNHDLEIIFNAIEAAARQYLEDDGDGGSTMGSAQKAFGKVPRIAVWMKRNETDPGIARIHYIKGILRNRFGRIDERAIVSLLRDAVQHGAEADELQERSKTAASVDEFVTSCSHFLHLGEWDAPLGSED